MFPFCLAAIEMKLRSKSLKNIKFDFLTQINWVSKIERLQRIIRKYTHFFIYVPSLARSILDQFAQLE
jgi:hypothetical protein